MRATARPQPLRVPSHQNYVPSHFTQTPQSYFSREPRTIQELSYQYDLSSSRPSPIEPLFTPLQRFGHLSLVSPFVHVPSLTYHHVEPHVPTAFQSPFTFFNDFPLEVREKVYDYLLDEFVIEVDGARSPAVRVLILKSPIKSDRSRLGQQTSTFSIARPMQIPEPHFLCISKHFFVEIRDTIYKRMSVLFERRWDFINAHINRSLNPNGHVSAGSGSGALSLFSQGTDVFSHVRSLDLNLTSHSDFDDRVYTDEARRVTTSMFQIIQQGMPQLKELSLMVDPKSRSNTFDLVYVPAPWFLDAIIRITHIKSLQFKVGPGWNGYSQSKRNARICLEAINEIFAAHYRDDHLRDSINPFGEMNKLLQLNLAKKMLINLSPKAHYGVTVHDLSFAVAALDTQNI